MPKAWLSTSPNNAWATLGVAEVHYRKAELDEAFESLQAALKLDPCIPRIRYDLARFFAFNGMYATAKKYVTVAHTLDPIDDDIRNSWMSYQPRAERAAAVSEYLDDSKFLESKTRDRIVEVQKYLGALPPDSCHLVSEETKAAIPFYPVQDQYDDVTSWALDTQFNGVKKRLTIDTGASGLTLTKPAAESLHLTTEISAEVKGINDKSVKTLIAKVKSVKIGGMEFANCSVYVIQNNFSYNSDGLIGTDVFGQFLVTLDFPARVLKLGPLPPRTGENTKDKPLIRLDPDADEETPRDRYIDSSMKAWTPVFRSGHELIIPVQLSKGPVHLFIVDSGAFSNLISHQAAREVTKVENGSDIGELEGVSGKNKQLYRTGSVLMDFAGLSQATTNMTGMNSKKRSGLRYQVSSAHQPYASSSCRSTTVTTSSISLSTPNTSATAWPAPTSPNASNRHQS